MKQKFYMAQEVCDRAGIAKSTLIAWENQSWFPKVDRMAFGVSPHGQRTFTAAQCFAVVDHQLTKQFEFAEKRKDGPAMRLFQEMKACEKTCLLGDQESLAFLKACEQLTDDTLAALHAAADPEAENPLRPGILQLLLIHS
jgi:hypothetical protein